MLIAIDKIKIVSGHKREAKDYLCNGQYGEFVVPQSRCVEVDDEYMIQANLYGISRADEWARGKGYIK